MNPGKSSQPGNRNGTTAVERCAVVSSAARFATRRLEVPSRLNSTQFTPVRMEVRNLGPHVQAPITRRTLTGLSTQARSSGDNDVVSGTGVSWRMAPDSGPKVDPAHQRGEIDQTIRLGIVKRDGQLG